VKSDRSKLPSKFHYSVTNNYYRTLLALSAISFFLFFFVCLSLKYLGNCAKFTGKTCLIPHSDEFECQGQRSRSPGTKTRCALPSPPAPYEWYALAANNVRQQRTGPFRRCRGMISGACVWSMFGKTSLALVCVKLNKT